MANSVGGEGGPGNWSFSVNKQPQLPPKSPLFPGGNPTLQADATSLGIGLANNPGNNNGLFSGWPSFPYPNGAAARKPHERTPSAGLLPQTPPLWIDDLLTDASDVQAKKSTHRRSASDSVAFLDAPAAAGSRIDEMAEGDEFEARGVASVPSRGGQDFEKLDEEQLMSMFADIEPFQKQHSSSHDMSPQVSTGAEKRSVTESPSTPSDHNSVNEHHSVEDKGIGSFGSSYHGEPEVQSAPKIDNQVVKGELTCTTTMMDPALDPKRAKRILANRQSAQRSRVRKLQYIAELERSVNALQAEVSALSPQVAYLDHQRVVLNVDNSALKQRIAALAQEKLFKDAHYDALKQEVQRLRQIYQQQQQMQQLQQGPSYDLQQQRHYSGLELGTGLPIGLKPEGPNKVASAGKDGDSAAVPAANSASDPRPTLLKPAGNCGSMAADNLKGLEAGLRDGSSSVHSEFLVQNH